MSKEEKKQRQQHKEKIKRRKLSLKQKANRRKPLPKLKANRKSRLSKSRAGTKKPLQRNWKSRRSSSGKQKIISAVIPISNGTGWIIRHIFFRSLQENQ